jgi:hypothetical protein
MTERCIEVGRTARGKGSAAVLGDGRTAGHGLGDDAAQIHFEPGGFDLLELVLRGLTGGGTRT